MDEMDNLVMQQKQNMSLEEQKQLQEEDRQVLHNHLVELQNWDLAENQTIEQRRNEQNEMLFQEELKRNEEIRTEWQNVCASIQAKKTADGSPKQLQAPPRKTYKQRRADRKQDRAALKDTTKVDHVGMRMYKSLREEFTIRENSAKLIHQNPELEKVGLENKTDFRAMRAFCQGFKTNKKGQPSDEEQRLRMESDKKFLNEYILGTDEQRNKHLDRIVEEVLDIDLTADMFNYEYMEYHAADMQEKIRKMVYFENIMKEPRNKDYFDKMPKAQLKLIQYKVTDHYGYVGNLFEQMCSLKGVAPSQATLLKDKKKEEREANFAPLVEVFSGMMKEGFASSQEKIKNLINDEYNSMYENKKKELLAVSEQMKEQVEREKWKTANKADMTNLNFTGYVNGFSFDEMAEYRKLIEDHPDQFRAHEPIVDALYQQLYRSMDSIGDMRLELMVSQGILDDLAMSGNDTFGYGVQVAKKADLLQEETDAKITMMQGQISIMADALKSLLKNKPVSDESKSMIKRLGFDSDGL